MNDKTLDHGVLPRDDSASKPGPITKMSRRAFMAVTGVAGTGLLLGMKLPSRSRPWQVEDATFQPHAFLGIETDGRVIIHVGNSEMGQGVLTSLPMLIAEELDADWGRVESVHADADPKYGRQSTGGSSAVRTQMEALRTVGAAARAMLVQAAADQWGVDVSSLTTRSSEVHHAASGRSIGYGALAASASALAVPESPTLKDAREFTLLRTPAHRLDLPPKTDGSGTFGVDVRVDGMVYGTVVHCPYFGGSVGSFDDTEARTVEGVLDVFQVSQGVAVVAESTWAAFQGARALEIEWSRDFDSSSEEIYDQMRAWADEPDAPVARDEGDTDGALAGAATTVRADYSVPYLAHACMEPMNATADIRSDGGELWAPTQSPQAAQRVAAQLTGLPAEQIVTHVTLLGGGFGRRAENDFIVDAVECSMHMERPVQVTWTREETTRIDFYRPATFNRFEAGLGADGMPVAWKHRIVSPSIISRFRGRPPDDGIDFSSVEGAANLPYHIPNINVTLRQADVGVPVGWWRSVGSSQNAFITESFIDELAHAAGQDPYEYRRRLLQDHPRHLGVMDRVAEESGWGTPPPEGRARGIAIAESFGSFVAQVAEVGIEAGRVRVHRVSCAVDCGLYVNPDTIEAQMESAIVYGLSATLYGEITLEDGRVVQGNFNDYPVLRMPEMPAIDVHLLDTGEAPGGIGEPGTPPVGPAVANALFALTGVRVRELPIRVESLSVMDGAAS